MDEVDQETFDGYLSVRGRNRRKFLVASSFMGALAAIEPWFARLARAEQAGAGSRQAHSEGRVHVVPSTKETVKLGVFDTTLAPFLTIDSGDIISFPDTWSHFLNQMQPGVPVDTLAKLRVDNPGRGPHSIIGPIAVNKAESGDVLEIRYQRIRPYEWGAVFNNPGSLGTGLLPQDYAQGQTMLFRRRAYELMEDAWPRVARDPKATPSNRNWAKKLEAKPKYVVSTTRRDFSWNNTHYVEGDLARAVKALKKATPRRLLVGSPKLSAALQRLEAL